MKTDLLTSFLSALRYRFSLDEDKANESEVIENIRKGIEFKGINLWTLIFAIFIASIGLNVNSTAVIIGAMLISPLMGPIMGIGLGAAIYDFALIKGAAKNLLIATIISLATSCVYFFVTPLHQAQSELLARTSPTIWDVLIAFFGGLAGIVASSRKRFNNVIPGVAIATALMPPLCTAGYGLATGHWAYFFGAFYLYIINSVFISISTFLIVRFLKFKPKINDNGEISYKVRRWVGIIAILTIAPSIYLAYRFVKNEIFTQNSNLMINKELSSSLTVLYKNINPEKNTIHLTILDDKKIDSVRQVLEIKKEKYNLSNSTISIKTAGAAEKNDISLTDLRQGLVGDLFKKQEEQLTNLKTIFEKQVKFDEKRKEVIDEFYSLYGQPSELIIEKTILHNPDMNDTILLVYIKPGKGFRRPELKSMQNWLKTKFSIKTVKVLER
jgi:uncharacterized hydrophobic protein (TIGR00271 family)